MKIGDKVEFFSEYHNKQFVGEIITFDSDSALIGYVHEETRLHAVIDNRELRPTQPNLKFEESNPNASFRKECHGE